MANKMLIDATHPEETRVVVLRGNRVEEFDFESAQRKQLRGNIYLAKVTRVEPSLQAAFVDYGGNRHGFLAFSEIHPDYYQIPVADRQALIDEDERAQRDAEAERDHRNGRGRARGRGAERHSETVKSEPIAATDADFTERDSVQAGAEPFATEPAPADIAEQTPVPTDMAGPSTDATPEVIAAEVAETPITDAAPATEGEPAEQDLGQSEPVGAEPASTSIDVVPSAAPGGSGVEAVEEEEIVESVGGADALEEVPERASRSRRQYKIQEVIKRRQVMLVQVVKEERGTKGAALTTYLSLAGRYSVLMPNTARGGGISRKITNSTDRGRLKEIAQELEVPEGMGVILRTAGASRTKTEIKRDFEYLLRLWETVRDLTLKSTAPTLVYEEGSLVKRSIRDLYNKDIDEIVVGGDEAYKDAKEFMRMLMPSHAKNVKPYKDSQPILTRYGIESQLDAMFSPVVQLRSGGYIVLNQAEALVAIDVNSGRATREHHIEDTALKTNVEAAEEIARQLRLRDLAGLIVIDFIDMDEKRNNRTVERRLKESLKHDRARIQVGRISHFGLLEMSRQRIRTSVLESSTEKCPQCGGTGHVRSVSSVALQLLRAIEETLLKGATHNLIVRTRSDVALYVLNQKRAHLRELEQRFQILVTISADPTVTGQQSFIIDRGEQVHSIEQAKALAAQSTSLVPLPIAEDEEDEAIEDEQADVEGETPLQEAQDGQEGGESAQGQGRGRRRRRRRGRRGGGAGGGEPREPGSFTHETVPEHAVVHMADDAVEPVRGDAEVHEPHDQPAEGAGEPRGNGEHRRRRRGRRGGRRNRRDREGGEAQFGSDDQAPREPHEVTAGAAKPLPSTPDSAPSPAVPEPPPVYEPAPAEPAQSAPEPAQPRRRSTVREPVPNFGEAWQPSPAPTPPSAAEPAPTPPTQQQETERPRRSGWWSRR